MTPLHTRGPLVVQLRVALLALAALATAGTQAQTAGRSANRSGDHIVAVVNSESVTSVELAQRTAVEGRRLAQQGGSNPGEAALRQQALDALIDDRLQITYAREAGVKVDEAEIDRAVANIAAQNQLTLVQLRERLKADGMDWPRFRNNLRDQLMVERVREREVTGRIRVTDGDVDAFLAEQRSKLSQAAQLNIAQILITVPEGAADSVVAERRALAEAALKRVQGGEDFSKVAREVSQDSNREAGGEIGLRPADRLPDLFVDGVARLQPGQLTAQPLRSAAGFHVLKLVDRQQADPYRVTQTQARHILLRAAERDQIPAVARRLEDIRRQIERNEKAFDAVAREISEDGSAPEGGSLGWASPGQFVPEFEEAMNKLPVGGISAPVVSRFGVHLIQVVERREVNMDPKDVREQARNALREQKFDSAYLDWVKELRLRAYIEMRESPL
ncbi:MAG: peptidylprolyl isomerase [Burkholderiaceae bacterium]|nr:peptidylprolyl isomerase [Burkholderiaceae bacterium]